MRLNTHRTILHAWSNRARYLRHVCAFSGHTWRTGAVNAQQRAVKPGRPAQCLPLAPVRGACTASEACPARLRRGESQQNGGADASHVTPLCFRGHFQVNLPATTRLTDKTPSRRALATTPVAVRGRNISDSPR